MPIIDSFRDEHEFLSNYFPSRIEYRGLVYPTVEHAYQAAKTADPQVRERIRSAATPDESKEIGRAHCDRPDWEDVKLPVMYDLTVLKYTDPELRKRLLSTGDATLVEGNDWGDSFWGSCAGTGDNHMGKILMRVRDGLSRAEAIALLERLGARGTPHPGGNLFDHLVRVEDRLKEWGAEPAVCSAGLMHALYVAPDPAEPLRIPVDLTERESVAEIIGAGAEELVYVYGACDLDYLYPRLSADSEQWRDRFTGAVRTLRPQQIRDFMELTVANELDIAGHDRAVIEDPEPVLIDLVARARQFLSAAARAHCDRVLA